MDTRKKLALFSILAVGITVPYFPFVWQVGNYEHAISIYNVIFCVIGIITYFFVTLTLNYKVRKAYLVGLVIFLMMAYLSLAYLGGFGQDFLLSSKTVLSSVFLLTLYLLYLAYLVLIRPYFPLYGKKPGWFVSVYSIIFVIFSMIHLFRLTSSWQFPGVVTNLVSYIIQVAIVYEALRIIASKPADFVKKMVASVILGWSSRSCSQRFFRC